MTDKVYVSMTDKSKSIFDDRIRKIVAICDDIQEAEEIADAIKNKKNMEYVNIRFRKPYYNSKFYYVQYKDKVRHPTWFIDFLVKR